MGNRNNKTNESTLLRNAYLVALIQQEVLGICAMVADDKYFSCILGSIAVFWIIVLLLRAQNSGQITHGHVVFINFGVLPITVAGIALTSIIRIWL